MRSAFFLACCCVVLATGCATHHAVAAHAALVPLPAPVVVSNSARETVPGDYLRLIYPPKERTIDQITNLAGPRLRAFTAATVLYLPPLKLSEMPYYSGLENKDQEQDVLVALRCRPPHPETVDALLATWPNVFLAIQRDVPLPAGACDAASADPGIQMACLARAFTDPPDTKAPPALARTFNYAATLFDDKHTDLAKWLKSSYGIYPAFSGLGYSVKDSYSLDQQPMTSQQMLVKSVSSEYILKNVSLAEAGCRCIWVKHYTGRSNDPLDPEFIWQAGGNGSCKVVEKLEMARPEDKR